MGDIEEQFTHGGEAGYFPGIVFEVLVEYMAGDAVGVAFDGVVEKSGLAPVGSGEEVLCPGAGVLVEFEVLGDLLVEGIRFHRALPESDGFDRAVRVFDVSRVGIVRAVEAVPCGAFFGLELLYTGIYVDGFDTRAFHVGFVAHDFEFGVELLEFFDEFFYFHFVPLFVYG